MVVPRTIQSLTAPKYRNDVGVESPPYTLPAALAVRLLALAILALCVFLVLEGVRDRHRRHVGAVVLLTLPWLYLEVRDWAGHEHLSWSTLVYPAVVLALWTLQPALSQLEVIGYLVGGVALLSMAIGFLLPGQGIFRHADGTVVAQTKALVPGGVLVGIFTHGNNLGQFLVLGLPMVALIRSAAARHVLLLSTVCALVWSASRSSLLTLGVVVATVVVLALLPRGWRGFPARLGAALGCLVVVVLPLVTADPLAYSNRGYVWLQSLLAWRSSPLFGHGSNYYAEVAATSGTLGPTVFHGHNQVVQLLVTGGIVAALVVGALALGALSVAARAVGRGCYFPIAYLVTLAGTCTFEVSLVFVDNTFLFPVVVLPLACLFFGDPSGPTTPRRALYPYAESAYLATTSRC